MLAHALLVLLFPLLCFAAPTSATISGTALLTGKALEVSPGKIGTVMVFLSSNCPCSNSHVPLLKKVAEDFKDFSFVAVHSNSDEPLEKSKPYFKAAQLPFPVLQDHNAKLADEYRALKTPHVFVLSPAGKVLYRGGVTSSATAAPTDTQFLREALSDITEGKPLRRSEGRTLGCVIAR